MADLRDCVKLDSISILEAAAASLTEAEAAEALRDEGWLGIWGGEATR